MKDQTCLVVVDVQNGLVDAGPHGMEGVLDKLVTLLREARLAGLAVAHVQHGDPPRGELEPGKAGWDLAQSVQPAPGEPVFHKRFNSAFKGTGLEDWLDGQGVETLVIGGLQTEHCIDATVKSAFEKGYRVVVPDGCHTTFANGSFSGAQLRDFFENRIWRDRYATIEPVESLIKAWGPRSRNSSD